MYDNDNDNNASDSNRVTFLRPQKQPPSIHRFASRWTTTYGGLPRARFCPKDHRQLETVMRPTQIDYIALQRCSFAI